MCSLIALVVPVVPLCFSLDALFWVLLLAVGRQFTVQNPKELYVLVSSALPTTRRDMTCTVLKAT